ncbi:MAG: hypothetical protein ACOCVC_08945 [Spirochaeta sp.]
MQQNKFPLIFIALILIALYTSSCASSPDPDPAADPAITAEAEPAEEVPDIDSESESESGSNVQQDEHGFLYYTSIPDEEEIVFAPYSVVFALNSILANTGLNPALEPEHKLALADHLFLGYPSGAENIYREVALPQYFPNDDPLILQLRSHSPGEEAEIDAEGILVIQTNLYIDEATGEVDPGRGRFGNLHQNISFIFLISPEGALVSAQRTFNPNTAPDAVDPQNDDPRQVLAAVENWIHDGRSDNLPDAQRVLDQLDERTDIEPVVRGIIKLNRFLYSLRTGDSDAAEEVIQDLQTDEALREHDDFARVINTEAADMLTVFRELSGR